MAPGIPESCSCHLARRLRRRPPGPNPRFLPSLPPASRQAVPPRTCSASAACCSMRRISASSSSRPSRSMLSAEGPEHLRHGQRAVRGAVHARTEAAGTLAGAGRVCVHHCCRQPAARGWSVQHLQARTAGPVPCQGPPVGAPSPPLSLVEHPPEAPRSSCATKPSSRKISRPGVGQGGRQH